MAELYGVDDELPPDLGDVVVDEAPPVGPADDEETASADPSDDQ